jgi:hypothetical protein
MPATLAHCNWFAFVWLEARIAARVGWNFRVDFIAAVSENELSAVW